jgi:DNA-binding LytR/AlgR family response regulator
MYAYREINCMGFLPRQFKGEELQRILEKVMHHSTLREGDKNICVRAQGIIYPFQIKDILYIEVLNRVLYIYRIDGEVLEMHHKPLRDFQAEVDSKCLIQCNKSMLMNILYAVALDEKEGYVTLSKEDVQLLVGKKYLDKVRAAMQRRKPKYILK